jgi:hypothetical protein
LGLANGEGSSGATSKVNGSLIEAIKAARKEGRIDAIRECMRSLHSAKAWSDAKDGDSEYYRGVRDGLVLAMEAIGYNRWETQRGMKSGNLSEQKKG